MRKAVVFKKLSIATIKKLIALGPGKVQDVVTLSDDNLKNFLTPTVKKLQQEAKKSLESHTEWPQP